MPIPNDKRPLKGMERKGTRDSYSGNKQSLETVLESAQIAEEEDNNFKVVTNMFKGMQKTHV